MPYRITAFPMRSNDFQIRGAGVRSAGLSYDDTIFRVRTGIVELGYEFGNGSAGIKLRTSGIGITVTGQIDTTDINTGIITATNFTKTVVYCQHRYCNKYFELFLCYWRRKCIIQWYCI